ncbi:MAG: hypothetical protein HYY06_33355 [Deltaproteobacteria bacterium]|nr:hypothetical protein [Deltaproteobacteria bacterium]
MRLAALAFSIVAVGCGDGTSRPLPELTIPAGCNPLASDADCLLPFPSDFFLVEDAAGQNGRRVELGDAALLKSPSGAPVRPPGRYPSDGFSPGTQILALFGTAVDPAPLVFHTGDVAASLGDESPTVILDAATGERVLHFAEIDPRAEDDAKRALALRPLVRLRDQTRYVVAIRGLAAPDGAPITAPEGFRRIRDGQAEDDEILSPLAERYEREVFPVLELAGVDRAGLLLAWDFTTQSEQSVTGDMLAVRDDLVDRLGRAPPEVTVVEVADDVDDFIARRIAAEIEVPLYMESAEPGALLNRDEAGRVVANGTAQVPVTVLVPRSVALADEGATAPRLLQFGHGFFGGRGEIDSSFVPEFADRFGFVVVAADWWGMSRADMTGLLDAIATDPSHALDFTDRVHQGMANFIALAEAAAGPLRDLDEMQIGRAADYDDAVYYYGISNGHILGGTYLALSPRIERGVLGSGGADYSFMMFRAHPFAAFLFVIEMFVPDPLDIQKFAALSQATFDRIDPITYAPHVLGDTYAGSPAGRRVLIQIGVGDSEVPNLASHLHARALGIPLLAPAPRQVAALEEVPAPLDGSAMVEFDFGVDPLPGIEAVPPEETNPVHEAVRRLDASMRQVDAFLRPDGRIEATCEGPCDPE